MITTSILVIVKTPMNFAKDGTAAKGAISKGVIFIYM